MSHTDTAVSTTRYKRAAVISLLAVVLLAVLFTVPGNPAHFTLSHWLNVPFDVPVIVLLLVFFKKSWSLIIRILVSLAVLTLLLLRLGDLISRTAFGRAFNPAAEWHLVQQGWTLTAETIGKFEAMAMAGGGILTLVLLAVILYWSLGYLGRLSSGWRKSYIVVSCIVIAMASVSKFVPVTRDYLLPGKWVVANELVNRVKYTQRAIKDQLEFTKELEADQFLVSQPSFAALEGRDVLFLFVESYGRTFIDSPQFVDIAAQRLQAVQSEVENAGLHVKSGWVDSPIRGGRSWLAHATVASGLRLTSQARFDRLITSDRKPLAGLFKQAGWSTSVVLPVVKTDWVEGAWYQVDKFIDKKALDYKGKGFGFVTMPDQYTLSTFESQVRAKEDKPLMAHIGLLDSHAPWGPLPVHQSWEDIGDGSIFDGTQRFGDRHSWAKPKPVRIAYGVSLDQDLKLVGEYLARYAEDALVVVLGDHQPASVIAGWAPNAHVPMHVFSADPTLLDRLPSDIFTDGMMPSAESEGLPMESIRGLFGTVFENTDFDT